MATLAVSNDASVLDLDSNVDVDKLTYEIFSILENKFLFGYDDPKLSPAAAAAVKAAVPPSSATGKVRVLSIDGGGSTDGVLAAKSLAHLEATLRRKSGNPNARVADFFDVVAGSGAGGILAALLFARGKTGLPLLTAQEALKFMVENGRRVSRSSPAGIFRRSYRPSKVFKRVFGDLTLKDTIKAVLIPCYDLTTGATFLFSRADALEMDSCDFTMANVCGATVADRAVDLKSVDGRTKIAAVGGGVAVNNPTAAAMTHVLNNKHEFPFCKSVEDLLVVSLGNGEADSCSNNPLASPAALVKIAGDGAADMVDQAVSMAFGESSRRSNYVRIQGNIGIVGGQKGEINDNSRIADEMLSQKNVESVLFKGKKLGERSNMQKLDLFADELMKEEERRKTSILPPVVLKQQPAMPSPRTSSATTLSTGSSSC